MRRGSDLTGTDTDLPIEAPPDDAAEQRREVADDPGDRLPTPDDELPTEADPADVVEQQEVVEIDDEEAAP